MNDEECAQLLLQKEPSLVQQGDRNGWTPLHLALLEIHTSFQSKPNISAESRKVIEILLKHGANVQQKATDRDAKSCRELAAEWGISNFLDEVITAVVPESDHVAAQEPIVNIEEIDDGFLMTCAYACDSDKSLDSLIEGAYTNIKVVTQEYVNKDDLQVLTHLKVFLAEQIERIRSIDGLTLVFEFKAGVSSDLSIKINISKASDPAAALDKIRLKNTRAILFNANQKASTDMQTAIQKVGGEFNQTADGSFAIKLPGKRTYAVREVKRMKI